MPRRRVSSPSSLTDSQASLAAKIVPDSAGTLTLLEGVKAAKALAPKSRRPRSRSPSPSLSRSSRTRSSGCACSRSRSRSPSSSSRSSSRVARVSSRTRRSPSLSSVGTPTALAVDAIAPPSAGPDTLLSIAQVLHSPKKKRTTKRKSTAGKRKATGGKRKAAGGRKRKATRK